MSTSKSTKYGILTGLALIFYFLLMALLGLESVFELRLFNFFILFAGVFTLHRSMFNIGNEKFGYLNGLLTGIRSSVLAIFMLLVFLGFYTYIIDPDFLATLRTYSMWGSNMTVVQSAVAIAFEGLASAVIICFISMQYHKGWAVEEGEVIKK